MIGKTISHYKILAKLGEGGMGVVYRAEDTKLGRDVALKFLSSDGTGSSQDRARFLREARAAAALDHPNICAVHEISEAEGQVFIAMACVEGENLKDRITAGALDLSEALDIAAQVADGLAAAHERGIVHRDIKPANLMVTPEGRIKIMDFGLAKLAEATRLTKPGSTVGTIAYMSPEQARGRDADHRADIWAVGVVLYEMATGQRPFQGTDTQAVVYSILNDRPPLLAGLLSDTPAELEELLSCCLAKEADDRFQTAGELAAALRGIRVAQPDRTPGVSPDAATIAAGTSPPSDLPREIAGYKILQRLGEGGMGMVYLAEQQRPVRRKVALKVIKLGMDTKEVIARFESERQALAMMSHPNIARIFDAGSTDEGRPYFAMEYVPGESITEYCDKHRLSIRERLDLFIDVCRAIHHAHQKAIIHRDIKPSNILVMIQDDRPVPKVIDFGVAKATTQHLTERTVFTEFGELVGTPEYMSPEQLEMTGLDVDTTTDVYSLGVLLYELLVGALPFDPQTLREAGWDGLRRLIREVDPPRPSTRISTMEERATEAASRRRTESETLRKLVHGELDWITMRALEKDRTRRYQSASEFAADIERYLSDEPVQASPPSTSYRLRKFLRRHRAPVAAAAAIALAVLVLGSVAFWQGRMAQHRAEQIREKSILFAAEATEDPFLKALLVLELADTRETPERLAVARKAADGPLPAAVLQGHGGPVYDIDFSPDGTRLVTGSGDGRIVIWRADGTGDPVVLGGHAASVQDVAFSPDGTRVVSCAFDSTARVWSADGIGHSIVLRHGAVVSAAEFSPDGTHVLTYILNNDRPPQVWNVENGDSFALRHHPDDPHYVWAAFTLDGSRVVTTSWDDTRICVWQADGLGGPTVLRSPIHASYRVSFAPDGSRFVLAGRDKEACLWNIEGSGRPVLLRHPSNAVWAEFSPDGTQLLTADDEGTVRIWAADGTGTPTVLSRHGQGLSYLSPSPDGSRVLAQLSDDTVIVSRTDGTGEPLTLANQSVIQDCDFSPCGSLLATACADGTVRVFGVDRAGEPLVLKSPDVWCAEVSPDGTQVAAGHGDGTVQVRRADGNGEPVILGRHRKGVATVRFSPDNSHLVSASLDSTARIWRLDGSEEPIVLSGHEGPLWQASFSPDGTRVVTASRDGTARVWPADGDGEPLILGRVKTGRYSAVYSVEFNSDGTGVLTATHIDNLVRLWPADGSGDPDTLAEHRGLLCASYNPDGSSMVTTSGYDCNAWLWRIGSSDEPIVLRGHSAPVDRASFSPDGSRFLTLSDDGEVRLWPADGRSEPLILRPHRGSTYSAEFTPDGTSIITTGPDEIRIQRITWPALIDYFRRNTHACLTPEQRVKYLAETPREAWAAYAECERRRGRTSAIAKPSR